jgi:hypothetical protein
MSVPEARAREVNTPNNNNDLYIMIIIIVGGGECG